MNDTSKPPDTSDKPNADPRTMKKWPDSPPPDTASRPVAKSDQAAETEEGDDNALESIGKAVSAPVLGAADEDPDAEPER